MYEYYQEDGLSWKCLLEITKKDKLVIRISCLGQNKKISKTLACKTIIDNSQFNVDYPDKPVAKQSILDDYKQNNYILFGDEFLTRQNYRISYHIKDLSYFQNQFVAIDTEGRDKKNQKPIIIQIADNQLCVILNYQHYQREIQTFLNTKKVFVFGGHNEFRIMGFRPRNYIEIQTESSMSLKNMASDYHQIKEIFLKPNKYFYSNQHWYKLSREHIIYAVFDALNTYLLGINMVNNKN